MFLDTIFTVSLTLLGGLFWGSLTGVLTNTIIHIIEYHNIYSDWYGSFYGHLFAICQIAVALVTYLFMRIFPGDLCLTVKQNPKTPVPQTFFVSRRLSIVTERVVVLALLAFALALIISILGGLISTLIGFMEIAAQGEGSFNPASIEIWLVMFGNEMPVIWREILTRIPINIPDRLISSFAGYGIALAFVKMKRE